MKRRLAFLLTLFSFVAVACSGDPARPGARILILSGANVTDTVMAELAEPLVIEVRDEDGEPAANVPVALLGRGVELSRTGDFDGWPTIGRDSTDEAGRVTRWVRMREWAGPAFVLVDAYGLGVEDTARYEVLPGAPTGLGVKPWDWTVSVGGGPDQVPAYVRDRFWNERPEPVTYSALDDVVSIEEDGVIRGLQVGVGQVSVHGAGFAITLSITVAPRGRLVARIFERFGPPQLVSFGLDGSGAKTLAIPLTFGSMAPDWAPAGDRVVFHALVDNVPRLHVVDPGDGPEQRLIADGLLFDRESYPQYAPDGQWIYFSGQAAGEAHAVWRVRPDGSDPERVGPLHEEATVFHPGVSPDGGRVAYASRPFGTTDWRLYVLHVATGAVDSLGIAGHVPRWSPDGDRIAFVWQGVVYHARPDGTDVQTLSDPGSEYGTGLDWSPDGEWLAVSTPEGHNRISWIDLIEVATGRTLRLPFTLDRAEPSWHPTIRYP